MPISEDGYEEWDELCWDFDVFEGTCAECDRVTLCILELHPCTLEFGGYTDPDDAARNEHYAQNWCKDCWSMAAADV